MTSPHDRLGEAATRALVLAAERWPVLIDLQQALAPVVTEYQRRLLAREGFDGAAEPSEIR